MKDNGLCFTQPITMRDGKEYIDTYIVHAASAQYIISSVELPNVSFQAMNEVQSKGAIISYMRRYAIMSILGLVTEGGR